MSRQSLWSVVSLASLVCFVSMFVGCGPGGPKTHPVTGKVTIGGEPASNCRIDFQPIGEGVQTASGVVGSDGTYTLTTGVTGTPGAMAGKYKVVLVPDTSADTSYMDTGTAPPTDSTGGIPEEYTNAATTPKEVEVTAGSNTIDIEI